MDAAAELSLILSGADMLSEPNFMGAIDGADGEIEQTGDGLAVFVAVAELDLNSGLLLALALGDMLDHNPALGT
jgi:hypothetical protein